MSEMSAPKKVILLVEDELAIVEIIREFLNDNKMTVIHARTKSDAILKLGNQEFDCILLDLMLEGWALPRRTAIDKR